MRSWWDSKAKACHTCGVSLDKKFTMAFSERPGDTKWYCDKCGIQFLKKKYPDKVSDGK